MQWDSHRLHEWFSNWWIGNEGWECPQRAKMNCWVSRGYDCAILHPGTPLPMGQLHSLSGPGRKAVDKYIQGEWSAGIIIFLLWGLGFSFVKKKNHWPEQFHLEELLSSATRLSCISSESVLCAWLVSIFGLSGFCLLFVCLISLRLPAVYSDHQCLWIKITCFMDFYIMF